MSRRSPIAAIIAHFATVPVTDAQRDLDVIKAVLRQRERTAAVAPRVPRARRPRRTAAQIAADKAAVAAETGGTASATLAPVASGPKRRRRRGRRANSAAGTTDAAPSVAGNNGDEFTPLPEQVAFDDGAPVE